jgi:NADH:ubiquinone oxidoreductase subunit 6 (subunit J)
MLSSPFLLLPLVLRVGVDFVLATLMLLTVLYVFRTWGRYVHSRGRLFTLILVVAHLLGLILFILIMLAVYYVVVIFFYELCHMAMRATIRESSIVTTVWVPYLAFTLAYAVVVLRNPMQSLLSLIGLFLLAVIIYIANGAEFLGLVFLIVYVGAVAILFLFVIMLLNVKTLTSSDTLIQRPSQVLSLDAGIYWGFGVLSLSFHTFFLQFTFDTVLNEARASSVGALLYYVNYGAADVMAFATLYSDQVALFLLITIILLVAMLGAIVLATATLDEEEPLFSVGDHQVIRFVTFSSFFEFTDGALRFL